MFLVVCIIEKEKHGNINKLKNNNFFEKEEEKNVERLKP